MDVFVCNLSNSPCCVSKSLNWQCSNLGQGPLCTQAWLLALRLLFQPSHPTCFNRFYGSPYFPPPSNCPPFSKCQYLYHLSLLHPTPTSYTGVKRRPSGCHPHLPPTRLHRANVCGIQSSKNTNNGLYIFLRVSLCWIIWMTDRRSWKI